MYFFAAAIDYLQMVFAVGKKADCLNDVPRQMCWACLLFIILSPDGKITSFEACIEVSHIVPETR